MEDASLKNFELLVTGNVIIDWSFEMDGICSQDDI